MAISLNDNLAIQATKPNDDRFGPHATVSAANTYIGASRRFIGLTVGILTGSTVSLHWYQGGIADGNLVEIPSGEETLNFDQINTTVFWKKKKSATMQIIDVEVEGSAITGLAYGLATYSGSDLTSFTDYASLSALNTAIAALTNGDHFWTSITATMATTQADGQLTYIR